MKYLLLEDKLGISMGYRSTWSVMRAKSGLIQAQEVARSIWRSKHKQRQLLVKYRTRKVPAFNDSPAVFNAVEDWVEEMLLESEADAILCMDQALLGLVEPQQDVATIDNLRGGVYEFRGKPFMVTTPISAIHFGKNTRDIKMMNGGADSLEEWLELNEDGEGYDVYIEPYTVKAGAWILMRDLEKFVRITGA